MQKIYEAIFQLLKYSLFPNLINKKNEQKITCERISYSLPIHMDLSEKDWNDIFVELKNQSIIAIPAEYVIQNISTPPSINKRWFSIAYGQVGMWTKVMEEQQKLIKLFDKNKIPMAIIKGSVSAMNYPKAEYRTMGDVDFFVKREDFEKAYQLMLDNGYQFAKGEYYGKQQLKDKHIHHIELIKGEITFEIHKKMSGNIQNEQINQKMQEYIEEGFGNLEIGGINSYQFPMFSKKVNGLIFIRHIIQHLGGGAGIGMRHIIDWMMYVDKYLDDTYWNEEFETAVSEIGLKDSAIIFTRMCQLYLGLSEEHRSWCIEANESLCSEWMDLIARMGNFGRKSKKEDEGAIVIFKNKNIFTLLKSLQRLGLKNWKATEKYFFLRPFAWIYQMCRYMRKAIKRKNPVKTIKKDIKKSRLKKQMITELNIGGCVIEKVL